MGGKKLPSVAALSGLPASKGPPAADLATWKQTLPAVSRLCVFTHVNFLGVSGQCRVLGDVSAICELWWCDVEGLTGEGTRQGGAMVDGVRWGGAECIV